MWLLMLVVEDDDDDDGGDGECLLLFCLFVVDTPAAVCDVVGCSVVFFGGNAGKKKLMNVPITKLVVSNLRWIIILVKMR